MKLKFLLKKEKIKIINFNFNIHTILLYVYIYPFVILTNNTHKYIILNPYAIH